MKQLKKLLVVGGLHGDESSGVDLVRRLQKVGLNNIKAVVANPEAVGKKVRFLETDMNRSFGVETPISLEERRASNLKKEFLVCDAVIDVHNTRARGTTCAITVCEPNKFHLGLATYFGFTKVVVMSPSGSLISVCPDRSISLEIENGRKKEFSTNFLVGKIVTMGDRSGGKKKLDVYQYVNKVSRKTLMRLGVDLDLIANFKKLSLGVLKKLALGRSSDYYPIFFKSNEKEEISFILVKYVGSKSLTM
ncbi:MAG: succinylglutamate desuccinylase/aspartoacylase family protein [Patescibacteria group bacterium]